MRALRIVPRAWDRREPVADCPVPETPIKPVKYGAAPWGKLPPTPTADQLTIRARVQSMRSRGGKVAELLSYEDSLAYLARSAKPSKHSVTVPEPLREPAAPAGPSLASETPFRAPGAVQAPGANLPAGPGQVAHSRGDGAGRQSPPVPEPGDQAGWDDYMRRAFAGEFEPF